MEYSVGDYITYSRDNDEEYLCKIVKVAHGSAWWCLDGEESTRGHGGMFVKREQFIRIESVDCNWTNSCIASSHQVNPHGIFVKKRIKKCK